MAIWNDYLFKFRRFFLNTIIIKIVLSHCTLTCDLIHRKLLKSCSINIENWLTKMPRMTRRRVKQKITRMISFFVENGLRGKEKYFLMEMRRTGKFGAYKYTDPIVKTKLTSLFYDQIKTHKQCHQFFYYSLAPIVKKRDYFCALYDTKLTRRCCRAQK